MISQGILVEYPRVTAINWNPVSFRELDRNKAILSSSENTIDLILVSKIPRNKNQKSLLYNEVYILLYFYFFIAQMGLKIEGTNKNIWRDGVDYIHLDSELVPGNR